jgi:hypothetical protein
MMPTTPRHNMMFKQVTATPAPALEEPSRKV